MNNNDLLAEIVSKYGQYNNPAGNVNPFLNLNSAGTFVSTFANGQGAGANMSQDQQDEARYYFLKAMQQAGVQGKVSPEDAQWLKLAGQDGYGYTKESVLDAAKRNILTNGVVNPQDAMILDQFNQGPTRWNNEAGTFKTEAEKYGASPFTMQMGQQLGFQNENPFDGMDYNDAATQWKALQYAQTHPNWTPMQSTYRGGPPPSVGLGAGSYANGANPYPENPSYNPATAAAWAQSNPVSTTTSQAATTPAQKPVNTYNPEGTGGIGIPPPATAQNNAGQTASPTYATANANPYQTGLAGNQTAANGTGTTSLDYAKQQKKNLNFVS